MINRVISWWKNPEPEPVISGWVRSMEWAMKAAENERNRLYRKNLQKRGRRARLAKLRPAQSLSA